MKILCLLLASAVLVSAQTAAEWKRKGDSLESAGKPREALDAYLNAEKTNPNDSALLVKIAKQYGDMMPTLAGAAKKEAAAKSLAYSRKAVAVNPKSSDSHLAVALSLGKSTEFMGAREKITTSREIKTSAETALRLNPKSDYAHHMLGRWHQAMCEIGGGTRALAKVIYGGIPKGSYEEALKHFDQARKINSRRLIHQVEYGRTLAFMGRKEDAKREINKGLNMPNREADDADTKRRGRETLNSL